MFNLFKKKIKQFVKKFSEKVKKEEKEIETEIKKAEKKKEKKGLIERLKQKIKYKKVSEADLKDILEELEVNLIEADASIEVVEKIKQDLLKNLVGKEIERKKFKAKILGIIKKSIGEILEVEKIDLDEIIRKAKIEKGYATILFFGTNGVGKSLSIAKLANFLQKKGYKVVLAAGDTFRAAGDVQLESYAKQIKVPVIKHQRGADAAAVIFDARKFAEARNYDVVIADTSGRMHTKQNLLDELKKIVRVNKPDLKVLVLDSLTGNDVIYQYKFFNDAVGIDAIVFTKVDVNEKGGNILSICYAYKKPILFLGIGQGFDDLIEFNKEKILNNLLPS